jgi:hypothetical protein
MTVRIVSIEMQCSPCGNKTRKLMTDEHKKKEKINDKQIEREREREKTLTRK